LKLTLGIFGIIHQYNIVLRSPKKRQERQVVTQLSSGPRSREVGQIACQRNVVLRIKDV
jgi:hypothetical protein